MALENSSRDRCHTKAIGKKSQSASRLEITKIECTGELNYENYLLKLSSSHDLPIIAGQEVFYLEPSMAEAHDALILSLIHI